jgi:integrase/recombinase XerD
VITMPKASGLPFQTWPAADQALWEAVFRASDDPFSGSERAFHFTGETRRALRSSYGLFLRFLSAKHPERLAPSPSTRIDRDIAMEHVDWRRPTCGAATIATGLDRLRLVITYMCPGADISWLLPIAKRLAAQAASKPAKLHLVTSDQLYALGVELMDDAAPSGSVHKGDACRYRDGLIIALLAVAPLRRGTLAALRVGEHLLKSGDLWMLEIPAKDLKTRQSLDFLLSGPLSARIDRYLAEFRDAIPGATKHSGLWPSNKGRPWMAEQSTLGFGNAPGTRSDFRSICIAFAMPLRLFGRSAIQRTCEEQRIFLGIPHLEQRKSTMSWRSPVSQVGRSL